MIVRAAVVAAVLAVAGISGVGVADALTEREQLEQEKLRAEIDKLQRETGRESGLGAALLRSLPAVTALVAVGGLLLTLKKQLSESRQQRDRDLEQRQRDVEQREREREQQEKDSLRRFDETFTRTLELLGSESEASQASGAASMAAFLKDRYAEMVPDIVSVVRANLKLDRSAVVQELLRHALERALPRYVAQLDQPSRLDLSHAHLARIDLEGIDLTALMLDVAFADLSHANLTGTSLRRLRGYQVDLQKARLSRTNLEEARLNHAQAAEALFHDANLVSATLKDANLSKAQFFRARLPSAHFERADLTGAKFEEADLNDAFFQGAVFDVAALGSLSRAHNWRKAHFDPETRTRLDALGGASPVSPAPVEVEPGAATPETASEGKVMSPRQGPDG